MKQFDFTCKRCGGCCGVVYFTKAEYKSLRSTAEKLGVSLVDCPFLGKDIDGKSLCRIYEQRPEICRLFGARADLSPCLKCPNQ
jgi:Fe-S-cluster containining protein